MGAGRDRVAGVAKGIAECHFDRGHVRLYGGRRSARTDVDCVSSNFLARGCAGAQLRLTANMLDGMVALASGRASKVGELYNEVPDRVSDAAVFIGAGYAWGGNVALGYIATILAIFTAYVRAAGKIAGAPNEFAGPMAKQHRMLVITIACLYSVVVPRSCQILHLRDFDMGVMSVTLIVIIAGCVITVLRRFKRIARALK